MSQLSLRDSFLKKHPNLRYGLGEWRQYEHGVWSPVSELVVRKQVQILIQANGSGSKLSNGMVSSVTELIRQFSYIPDNLFDANPNILTFNNTCLDLTTFAETPHSPTYYNTTKLNFDYDPAAQSSVWEKSLQHCPHVAFMQEFAGLCCTPDTKYEIALWLHGPPGGGKSTFIVGLESMLGPKCCTLGLNDLEKSAFGLSQIPGKTLAVSTEQPSHFVKCASLLNALISGESVIVNRKYLPQFSLIPRVKMLWAMNDLPRIDGSSGAGLFRRVLPVYWPAIAEADRDPEVKEEIAHSGMAIINWAIEGLKRLRARKRFDLPPALLASRETYRKHSDATLCFIDDCCNREDDAEVESSKLYEEYQRWCVKNGHHALASNRFALDMERLGFEKTRRTIGRFWLGLDLKIDFPDWIIE